MRFGPQALIVVGMLASVACTPTTPSPGRQCQHVLDLLRNELATTTSSDTILPEAAEMERIQRECTIQLMHERQELAPEAYREQARCVMASETLSDLMKCESDSAADSQAD